MGVLTRGWVLIPRFDKKNDRFLVRPFLPVQRWFVLFHDTALRDGDTLM